MLKEKEIKNVNIMIANNNLLSLSNNKSNLKINSFLFSQNIKKGKNESYMEKNKECEGNKNKNFNFSNIIKTKNIYLPKENNTIESSLIYLNKNEKKLSFFIKKITDFEFTDKKQNLPDITNKSNHKMSKSQVNFKSFFGEKSNEAVSPPQKSKESKRVIFSRLNQVGTSVRKNLEFSDGKISNFADKSIDKNSYETNNIHVDSNYPISKSFSGMRVNNKNNLNFNLGNNNFIFNTNEKNINDFYNNDGPIITNSNFNIRYRPSNKTLLKVQETRNDKSRKNLQSYYSENKNTTMNNYNSSYYINNNENLKNYNNSSSHNKIDNRNYDCHFQTNCKDTNNIDNTNLNKIKIKNSKHDENKHINFFRKIDNLNFHEDNNMNNHESNILFFIIIF